MSRHVLLFDVNETLLDLAALDPAFQAVFHDTAARGEWFTQALQSALVGVVTGRHHDFSAICRSALSMVARRRRLELNHEAREGLLQGMKRLPPHPEVPGALHLLKERGFRLATLTNSTPDVMESQLACAGLTELFEKRLSVEGAGVLKPAPQVYRYAARELEVAPDEIRLVAAHSWDVTGAIRAGCAGAFVGRRGKVLDPLGETPDIVGADLSEVAEAIVAAGRPPRTPGPRA